MAATDEVRETRTPSSRAAARRTRDRDGRFVSRQASNPSRTRPPRERPPRQRDEHGRFVAAPVADHPHSRLHAPHTRVARPRAPRLRGARGRFIRALVPRKVRTTAPTRRWTVLAVRDRRTLADPTAKGPGFRLSRRSEARLRVEVRRLRNWIKSASGEYAVVHSGGAPSTEHIEELIAAAEGTVDRGAASPHAGVLQQPDLCIDDDGSNPLLTRTWQGLVRDGAHAVTVGSPRPPSTLAGSVPRADDTGPVFVVRTEAVRADRGAAASKVYQRPTWWVAVLVVLGFAAVQISRIVSNSIDPDALLAESRWLDAARNGSVNGLDGAPLSGSSLWPALMKPVVGLFGTAGVRWCSLLLTTIAIGCASNAGSRLFGRWAARSTAVVLSIGFAVTGIATSATPAPLAIAAISVSMLGIALVEGHDRRSWILMAGIAATVAVIASYEALVFVIVLSWFFTLMRGKGGFTDSNTYTLVFLAGLLAWFLPTRAASVQFITAPRPDLDWPALLTTTAWLAGAVVASSVVVTWVVKNAVIRRRVVVLSSGILAIPFAQILSGSNQYGRIEVALAMVLVAPAIGGTISSRVAAWRLGHEVTPAVRSKPELLTVDPETGRIRNRLVRYSNRQVRLSAAAVIVASLWYLPWALLNIEWRNWWIAVPFLLANACMVGTALLSAFNNWNRAIPIPIDVARGGEPLVGVIVPTYSEPLHMVLNTVRSILDQDWPVEKLRIVVSDDAHSDQVRNAFETLAASLPPGVLLYNRPPKRGDPARRGESKSGNLNSAILLVDDCDFVETRDADDLVGSPNFLRATVSQLMDDPGLGFIQTIKETTTSPGDPFNNNEPFFYRGTMLARNADYAIFPCGSGLVWRRAALKEIDDFPVWNLVEDLHSGVLGLRAGWRGLYVPIVGAYAQHSPEDIANVFKQRGTWALDTTRILVFDRFRGIPRKMRLHFLEQAIFYLLSFPLIVLVVVPALGLFFDRFPLETDPTTYAIHFWGFALAVELILLALAADQTAGSLWRSRLSWVGMAPVYAKSAIRAVWYGPRRKPAYKVTRKTDEYQVYIKMVKVHWLMLIGTVVGAIVALTRDNFLTELDLGSLYWGIVAIVGLGAFLRLSWFGVDMRQRFTEKFHSPISYWWPMLGPLVMPVVRFFRPPPTDSRSRVEAATVRLRTLVSAGVQSAA